MGTQSINDDKVFDRLVDGELLEHERHELLASLDTQPDGWRRCALTFLEAQSLREAIGSLARGLGEDERMPSATPAAMPASVDRRSYNSDRSSGLHWLAIAAGLLLAFGLGWLGRQPGVQSAIQGRGSPQQVAGITPGGVNPSASGNAITLFVRDNSGRNVPVRVPLVDADTLDRKYGMRFQPTISDELRKKLEGEGFNVQSKRQYAPLWLENGRPMVVPVEDTEIVPVNNKVF